MTERAEISAKEKSNGITKPREVYQNSRYRLVLNIPKEGRFSLFAHFQNSPFEFQINAKVEEERHVQALKAIADVLDCVSFKELHQEEQRVLDTRYGFSDGRLRLDLSEIAKELSTPAEYVQYLERSGLTKLGLWEMKQLLMSLKPQVTINQDKEKTVNNSAKKLKEPRGKSQNGGFESAANGDFELERHVIEDAQAGDLAALGQLYESHANQVYRYALARVGNLHDAEDLTEEVFLKMLNGLPSYQWRMVPFSAWLMRIARNEVVSFARRNKKRITDTELPKDLIDSSNLDPQESSQKTMMLEDLRQAVSFLPEAQREVIILRFASGLSIKDTALTLGKSRNNVKSLQHKAKYRLQLILTPKYPELE